MTTKEIGFMSEYTPVYLSKDDSKYILALLKQHRNVCSVRKDEYSRFWKGRAEELIKTIKEAEGNDNE